MQEGELPKGPGSLDEVEAAIAGQLEALLSLLPAGPALEMGRALLVDMRESSKTRKLMEQMEGMALKAKESFNLRRSRVQFAMEDGFREFVKSFQEMLAKRLPAETPKPATPKRAIPASPKPPAAAEFKLLSADELRRQVLGIPVPGLATMRTTGNIWEGWPSADVGKDSGHPPRG